MANYHFESQVISRGKGRSVTRLANYISGQRLRDSYFEKTYYHRRQDVLDCRIFLPPHAPRNFIVCKPYAMRSRQPRYVGMPAWPESSRARCQTSCRCMSCSKLSRHSSTKILLPAICARLLRFTQVGTQPILQGTTLTSTSSFLPVRLPKPASASGRIVSTTSGRISTSGGNSGPLCKIEHMSGTA